MQHFYFYSFLTYFFNYYNLTDSEFLCTTVWELLFLPCFANVVTTNTSLRWIDWAHTFDYSQPLAW